MEPATVRTAKPEDKAAAWHNETLRYFYVCLRKGIDPVAEAQKWAALGAAAALELQEVMEDLDDGLPPGDNDANTRSV